MVGAISSASVAGVAGRDCVAGHAVSAGTMTSGAGARYPSEACGRTALYNTTKERPHSALGGDTPTQARRALELAEGSAPGALANQSTMRYAETGLTL